MIIQTLRPGEKEALLGAEWSYVPPTGGLTNSTADVVAKTAVAAKRNYVTKIRLLTSTGCLVPVAQCGGGDPSLSLLLR
jgi:hypothetical protein